MIDWDFTRVVAMIGSNAAPFASIAALTMGSAAYAWCIISARRTRAQFSLGKLEGFSILGVPRSATIDEVKQAYKIKVKQSHPDLVREMSPSFQQLAETETKKLNAAYQEALLSLQSA